MTCPRCGGTGVVEVWDDWRERCLECDKGRVKMKPEDHNTICCCEDCHKEHDLSNSMLICCEAEVEELAHKGLWCNEHLRSLKFDYKHECEECTGGQALQ